MAGRGFDNKDLASEAGKKGAATLKERFGRDHFVTMGKVGGASNKEKHGPDHFRELGRKGGQARWARERAKQDPVETAEEATDTP